MAFTDMRKIGSGRGLVSAYPRQLESLIRLSEAHAKMRFSDTVEIVDVEEAKRLHREALKQSATDPKTGIIDVGILTTGVSASERDRRKELAKELKRMLQVFVHTVNLSNSLVHSTTLIYMYTCTGMVFICTYTLKLSVQCTCTCRSYGTVCYMYTTCNSTMHIYSVCYCNSQN